MNDNESRLAEAGTLTTVTWLVLLRGINVGRNKRLAMADLRDLLNALGYSDVRTHLQSGNAIMTADLMGARELEDQIAARIASDLGLDVKVLVRNAKDLGGIVADSPFVAAGVTTKELHVAFLSGVPDADRMASLDRRAIAPDQVELGDRLLYLRLPDGTSGSRLPNLDRLLDLNVTVRNWNTVTKLTELVG